MSSQNNIRTYLIGIGKAVRLFRRKKGWTQEYLSFKSGLDRTYIGGLERGERNATIGTLLKVSNALGISIFDLIEEAKNDV